MSVSLTKDSDKLICLMYKQYLNDRKNGISKSIAKSFGSSHNIHEDLLSDWNFEDVDDTCRELSRAGLIQCIWADNIAYEVFLSDNGIIYMENRFKNGLSEVADFIDKIKPW